MSGHKTAEYINLKEQIEWLVQNKYLKENVDNQGRDEKKGGTIETT